MTINLLFSLFLLAFLIVIDLYTFKYPLEARIFPWLVSIPATVLMLIQVVKDISLLRRREEAKPARPTGSRRAYAEIIAWMVGFLLAIYVLGFLAGILLFVFLYLKMHGLSLSRSLALAAGLSIAIYGIFTLGMDMRLYPGLIYSLYLNSTNL